MRVLTIPTISFYAQIGSFAAGVGFGFLLLALGIVKMNEDERSIVCLIKQFRQNRLDDQLAAEARAAVQKAKEEEKKSITAERVAALKRQAAAQKQGSAKNSPTATAKQPQMLLFVCPCGQKIKVPRHFAGRTGICPACKQHVVIPSS